MDYILKAEKEMVDSGEEILSTGPVSQSIISEFEKKLGVFFPASYKCFLNKYGALSFCGDTYYGITQNGLYENQVPCVLFATNSARSLGDISNKMIKIKSSGYGPSYSIDTEIIGDSGEPVIVETELSFKRTGDKVIIAQSYGEFIFNQIREAIEDI
ncbi:cell wall assembly/cell proliferation coordinating protein [Mangrovibacter phragmitis]|uniref:Cell wall assembly/cell proliferation coordinating protein n=1 Tax=Mangrovibacter phragmitis TaxID=1691903 RepID=A0A1B7L412_9ENTR|nr:SMI1/KNR4 family protein [Mangrovibacter phragmitis]OAT76891.1 cell wall assembly/cell proliferation coordinating protein [Mangrovibacter phragmitis]